MEIFCTIFCNFSLSLKLDQSSLKNKNCHCCLSFIGSLDFPPRVSRFMVWRAGFSVSQ